MCRFAEDMSQQTHCNVAIVSQVSSTPRYPVPVLLHLLALQLKPNLSGLWAPEHPLYTPSLLVLIQVTRRKRKGQEIDRKICANCTANLLPSHWHTDPLTLIDCNTIQRDIRNAFSQLVQIKLLILFRHSTKSSIAQEECMTTSP